ncbi:exonuclease domain-containing protein [Anaeroselena agilis]|uniref:Exonuclease domain-containing protein n=1 Tax=Anaeroselena agilis TaxID=3063788 RepID=A0ABU3NX63_9FIRM|nr:exonuclease domain-containing protein [Selenomonadales bacterium 4137-cl]
MTPAADNCSSLPQEYDFVALDFETANREWTSICAVGLAFVADGRVVANPSWLVRPPQLIFDPGFVRIHGITADMAADKPEFGELWPELRPLLEGRIIIAHNAEFDINVLIQSLDLYRIPRLNAEYSCTKVIAQRTWPGWKRYGLAALAERHGIVFRHHDAGEDANVCAQVALMACREKKAASFGALHEALNITRGRIYPDGHDKLREGAVTIPAFGPWDERIHNRPEQIKRQQRAGDICDAAVDRSTATGTVNGYAVTLGTCTCADFQGRKLPCKHIYKLFFELKNGRC